MKIALIAYQILRRNLTTKKGFLMYILLPSLLIAGIVTLFGNTVKGPTSVAYANLDEGRLGADLMQQIEASALFRPVAGKDADEVLQIVRKRGASTGIIIPADFTERMLEGETGNVEVYQIHNNENSYSLRFLVDQKVNVLQQLAQWSKQAGGDAEGLALLSEAVERQSNPFLTVSQNAGTQTPDKMALTIVSGFMLMFMMGLMNSSVSTIMEDRQNNLTSRIFAAPVRKFHISAGNLLGIFIVGSLQMLSILLLTRFAFGFDYGLPLLEHFLVLELFLLATMGIASAAAGLVKNLTSLGMVHTMILTPTCMIGGCFWPREIMPEFLQKAGNFVPQSWTIDAIMELTNGASLVDIWPKLAVLLLMAAVLLGFGSVILKPAKAA